MSGGSGSVRVRALPDSFVKKGLYQYKMLERMRERWVEEEEEEEDIIGIINKVMTGEAEKFVNFGGYYEDFAFTPFEVYLTTPDATIKIMKEVIEEIENSWGIPVSVEEIKYIFYVVYHFMRMNHTRVSTAFTMHPESIRKKIKEALKKI